MTRYLRYLRLLSAFLVLQGAAGGLVKLAGGRSDDLAHSLLHLATGLVGWAMAREPGGLRAPVFGLAFGTFYLALALLGWLWPSAVRALHLRAADHLFHLVVGAVTLTAGAAATFARLPAHSAVKRSNVGRRAG